MYAPTMGIMGITIYSLFVFVFNKIDINSVLFKLINISNEYCLLPSEIKWVNKIIAANDIFSV